MSDNKIVPFIPQEDVTASENVKTFIRFCREKLTAFGKNLNWGAERWDLTGFWSTRGQNHKLVSLGWTNFDKTGTLRSPFLDFAKAYVRYRMTTNPRMDTNRILVALRALERILCESPGVPRIEIADGSTFHSAIQFVGARRSQVEAYQIGKEMERLADFISKKRLVRFPFSWKSPFNYPSNGKIAIRVGAEGDAARKKKLPAKEALEALAHAYSIAKKPRDVLITAVGALLCCAPSRISEVLTLSADCEEISDKGRYGLRWWPAKGAPPMIKWIPEILTPLAKEAIEKIRAITEPWRRVAKWYEEHPKQIYLPDQYRFLRGRNEISLPEIQNLVALTETPASCKWVKARNIRPITSKRGVYPFGEVERAVLNELPIGFPIRDPVPKPELRYSQSLFILPARFFKDKSLNCPVMIDAVTYESISAGLGASINGQRFSSVFTRLGITLPSGDPVVIHTHQMRHYLNTMLQRGGAGQMDIAQFSGRKDVGQNVCYDHVSGDELIERMRKDGCGSIVGPVAEFITNSPISKSDFIACRSPAAIATEVGFCTHDWVITPCQRHRDCVNCSCHVYLKGDQEKTRRLRECLTQEKALLEQAEEAHSNQTYGADRWLEHHRKTVAVREQVVGILDDPSVPDGSIITMSSNGEYSPIQIAVDDRIQLGGADTGGLSLAFSSNSDLAALP